MVHQFLENPIIAETSKIWKLKLKFFVVGQSF